MKKHLKGMAWFRAYHGLVAHPRWGMTAIRCKRPVPEVFAVAMWLMESASRHSDRGDISHFDAEQCAFTLGMEEAHVSAIIEAFRQGKKPWIVGDRIESWDERQPKREDESAAERKAKSRAAAQGHAPSQDVPQSPARAEQSRAENSRAEESILEEAPPKAAGLAPIRMQLTEKGGITAAPAPVPAKPRERKKAQKPNVSGEGKTPPNPIKPASDAPIGSQPQQNGQNEPDVPKSDHIGGSNEMIDDAAVNWLKTEGVRYLQSKGATLTAAGAIAGWAKKLNYRHTLLRGIFDDAIKGRIAQPIPYITKAVERAAGNAPLDINTINQTAKEGTTHG